jgi:O-antigen/teichoic acid export membrane protein
MRRLSNLLAPWRGDLLACALLLLLALLWFAPVLFPSLTGATLLPYDNLYGVQPLRSLRPDLIPHNNLLSDLVLENAVWKQHIRQTLADGQLPLWNPQIFTGIPFLAAGQASTFYPLSVLFYILPLEVAYGWFTALQIALAGINMYIFGRVLGLQRLPALFSGVVFMFSGFLIVSVVFTMFLAAVVWLPLLLAIVEQIIRKQEEKGVASFHPIPYLMAGIVVLALIVLAGHPELIYYTALVTSLYTVVRLVAAWRVIRDTRQGDRGHETRDTETQSPISNLQSPVSNPTSRLLKLAGWLLTMAVLGVAAGAIQLIPLMELVPLNFREGSASLQQVLDWAWPSRHVLTFFMPDIFGNPSHHAWFDLWQQQWMPATVNANGDAINTIFWGIKNYVEGGNYLGIATWLLAAIAVIQGGLRSIRTRSRDGSRNTQHATRNVHLLFFLALAIIALLFAFGTPLYAILFYGLPGWSQLHSPFRWVFPFTLSMAVLAGMGLQVAGGWWRMAGGGWRMARVIPLMAIVAGVGALGAVVGSVVAPGPFVTFGERVLAWSDLARASFVDGRMFWAYQAGNLVKFGLFAVAAGACVWWLTRSNDKRTGGQDDKMRAAAGHPVIRSSGHLVTGLLIAITILDLYAIHGRFNPASDPALSPWNPANIPPVVQFINDREPFPQSPISNLQSPISPWRFTTFDIPGVKTFNANLGMYYGWHDIRGYDSIIPKQYVDLMDRIAPQEGELLYNRIAPLYANLQTGQFAASVAALDNPLLDLLNVKYVLTEYVIANPSWQRIYFDGELRVYENQEVLPRAFIVPAARVTPVAEQPLVESDLRNLVFIEEQPAAENALTPASPQLKDAQISRYTANDIFVDVNLSDRGWLVLTDAYFPGWKAFIRPFGSDESDETELPIYRANSAFRTVYLPEAGQWTVRFVYTPMSFKLGLYISFLALMTTLLLGGYWLWGRYYRPAGSEDEVRTVAKNSLVPMILSLSNKAIDFAFAMLYVRILGPVGTGQYAFVVAVYGIFEIVSRYGLGTLLTRDVSADKNQSSRYLTNVVALRTLLWLVSLPLLGLVIWFYRAVDQWGVPWLPRDLTAIGAPETQALLIFAFSMLFANWADALSSTFMAFEKMEYPAGLANAVALLKVTFGALVLLLGWGYVGLAAVSLAMNILQTLWLYGLLRRTLFVPEWRWDWGLQRWMFANSGPLMINHLLATIFWRIDVWLLRPLAGPASIGLYSVGLKYLDGLNIIPSVFTMAVFPLMSRYARRDSEGGSDTLLRTYVLSLRLLVIVCLPIAMVVTLVARDLVYLVGGAEYLDVAETFRFWGREVTVQWGGSALALRVIIWSIPIGFVNSITQYVLIAVNQQRYLTKAFVLGVVFNIVGNLIFIPGFGYVGAAVVTILSEFSLLFPFYASVRRNVGVVPWWSIFWGPAVAVGLMGATAYGLLALGLNPWGAAALGLVSYGLGLLVTGVFNQRDMAVVRQALPLGRLRVG